MRETRQVSISYPPRLGAFFGAMIVPLRPIRILLRVHLLHTDFQSAVFREGHVLLLHVLLAAVGELIAPEVDLVAEVGCAADDGEEDDEREERGEAHVKRVRVCLLESCWKEGCLLCSWDDPWLG